ncbi:MAG: Xaa-Pro peptidase family protein [Candidatus Omnitrophica bacterium]|nr:Xaa-Pro peptidase family protein [Candidatus Omnitrophota bacterium]
MFLNSDRVSRLRSEMRRSNIDYFVVTSRVNLRYLTALDIEGILVVSSGGSKVKLISDLRYRQEAEPLKSSSLSVKFCKKSYISELIKSLGNKKGVAGIEETISLGSFLKLKNSIKGLRLAPSAVLSELRMLKDSRELASISKALEITRQTVKAVSKILIGKTEIEAQGLIEYGFKKRLAERSAFIPIVASGPRSALPHAKATRHTIKKSDGWVLIDCGAVTDGYCSDLTRMFFWDRIPKAIKKAYQVIGQAKEEAEFSIADGVKISTVVSKAENIIEKSGFKNAISHSLGHGIGLEIHEAPALSRSSKRVFKEGMVITLEPGIYLPGLGGVRVEDVIRIGKKGSLKLS